MYGSTAGAKSGCGCIYTTINHDEDGDMREVILDLGKAGGCAKALLEVIGRITSIALQYGVPPGILFKQMTGIHCPREQPPLILPCVVCVGERMKTVYEKSQQE